jgi:hypothetical protein
MQRKFSHLSIVRFWTAVLLTFTAVTLIYPGTISADEKEDLSELWIDLSLGPPLVQLFNERARATDVARVEHISQLDLLKDVDTGKKLVVFKSAEDAIRLLPHIHDEIDIIGYNLEHGPTNPVNEQENPVEYIRRLREAADEYDLEVALGPDHNFALSHAVVMAPYADYLILQIQKVQTEPDTVYDFVLPVLDFVLPVLKGVRVANPDIQTSVQIRTEGEVDDLLAMLEPLGDKIDGISILTSTETVEITEELMGELRALPVQPTPAPAEDLPVDVEAAAGDEIIISDNPLTATTVATTLDDDQVREQTSSDSTNEIVSEIKEEINEDGIDEPLSAPETNQRNGSTWLFVAIALIVGFALGAGYISYRGSS